MLEAKGNSWKSSRRRRQRKHIVNATLTNFILIRHSLHIKWFVLWCAMVRLQWALFINQKNISLVSMPVISKSKTVEIELNSLLLEISSSRTWTWQRKEKAKSRNVFLLAKHSFVWERCGRECNLTFCLFHNESYPVEDFAWLEGYRSKRKQILIFVRRFLSVCLIKISGI
jgi:hypothetical protein